MRAAGSEQLIFCQYRCPARRCHGSRWLRRQPARMRFAPPQGPSARSHRRRLKEPDQAGTNPEHRCASKGMIREQVLVHGPQLRYVATRHPLGIDTTAGGIMGMQHLQHTGKELVRAVHAKLIARRQAWCLRNQRGTSWAPGAMPRAADMASTLNARKHGGGSPSRAPKAMRYPRTASIAVGDQLASGCGAFGPKTLTRRRWTQCRA